MVDDAQWLDAASGQVLDFVARRLLAESVAIVFAVREPAAARHFEGLPELRMGGLDEEDARALLARPSRAGSTLASATGSSPRRAAIPLALLELPRGMSAVELAGGFEVPAVADLPGRLEDHYLGRTRAAGSDAAVAAAGGGRPVGDAALVWRAAAASGSEPTRSDPRRTRSC